jgi:hypothetical protein
VYNKKATKMLHAHWFVAAAQLAVGMVWSLILWGTGELFQGIFNISSRSFDKPIIMHFIINTQAFVKLLP